MKIAVHELDVFLVMYLYVTRKVFLQYNKFLLTRLPEADNYFTTKILNV